MAQLEPAAAIEALGSRLEPLLITLNERPFAAKAVEARNRAGHSGARLFRRNTVHSSGPGHLRAFHQGVRWELQLTLALFSPEQWGRDAVCVGIASGWRRRAATRIRNGRWRTSRDFSSCCPAPGGVPVTGWGATAASFNTYTAVSTELLPNDALDWLGTVSTLPTSAGSSSAAGCSSMSQEADILGDGAGS